MRSPGGLKVFLCLHAFGESFAFLDESSSCISIPLSGFVGVDVEQSSCLNLFSRLSDVIVLCGLSIASAVLLEKFAHNHFTLNLSCDIITDNKDDATHSYVLHLTSKYSVNLCPYFFACS